ncbi:nicotinamide mononucleotide deamidase-related protein YfaY [Shimwellia pseudoproteus]|uniref:nicotinamide mononucleotide deamidase-related protein YfaY n=1 Tax=Shimwellia pseudoproteus TaxID=570012 RepID=UPI0018EE37CC|nr:nicotinamide mononucleotide deamidase-related protein YfaY [Shimwellia pseudoproteus]MBJ3814377.1 nicotinamide mononucleotide deamidase-related protein YfaY [Shimwellia pseudoproteus]
MLKVEMLSTGDEVLSGQIVDTNAAWLADYFFHQGLPLCRRNTVGDNFADLVAVLEERSHQADILIVNGGLGPTGDDLSAAAAAQAAGVALEAHPEWLAKIEHYFAQRGRPMAPSNRKQALIPAGSEMIDNPVGTACGFALRLNRCWLFFTPGVPSEFKQMVTRQIMPRIRAACTLPQPPVCLRLTTFGQSESDLAQLLDPLPLPEGVVMGYRSSMPIIELKLTGPAALRHEMDALWPRVREAAGDSLIFEGTAGLPARVAGLMAQQEVTLSVAEQFTGGLLSLQLNRAGVALNSGAILGGEPETLAQTLARAQALSRQQHAPALVVSSQQQGAVNIALAGDTACGAMRVVLDNPRHSPALRQEIAAMLALNMLRRWLEGQPLTAQTGWVAPVAVLDA